MSRLDLHRWPGRGFRRASVMPAAAVICLLSAAGAAGAEAGGKRFAPLSSAPIPEKQLFDLGVADYNGDALLDLFTTNHKSHPALLRNDGAGTFTDQTGPAGFSQAPEYPGLELLQPPAQDEPGVYLYVTDGDEDKLPGVVHIRSVDSSATGRLRFSGEGLAVERSDNARVGVNIEDGGIVVDFALRPRSAIDIRVKPIDVPFSAEFDPPPPAQLPPPFPQPVEAPVFIGTDAVPAKTRQLLLTIRDRHGYAFADLGGDAATDAFAVSGGLGGSIELPGYAGLVQDELLIGSGAGFVNSTPNSGLIKGNCRGRQAAVVDVDADGLLDLFESCEGKRPQVYRQTARGKFDQVKSPRVTANHFRWVELGYGPRPELLASGGRGGVQVLQLGMSGWRVRQRVGSLSRSGQIAQFAVNDFDNDGDLDVLAVSGSGNTMFGNNGGRLRSLPMGRLGLPEKSVAASFVDYDNDGRVDLHLVPQGVMRREGKARFAKTGMLRSGGGVNAAVTSWPDLHNDGLRDPIMATGASVFSKSKRVEAFSNAGPGGNWLEVDLLGTPGNAQAIGARVSVGAGKGRQFQWVGQNDDSHYSQGHYRTYFGLGKREGVSQLRVDWPDGTTTRIGNVAANRLVQIQHP